MRQVRQVTSVNKQVCPGMSGWRSSNLGSLTCSNGLAVEQNLVLQKPL